MHKEGELNLRHSNGRWQDNENENKDSSFIVHRSSFIYKEGGVYRINQKFYHTVHKVDIKKSNQCNYLMKGTFNYGNPNRRTKTQGE